MSIIKNLEESGVIKWAAIFFCIAFIALLVHTCNRVSVKTFSQEYVDSLKKSETRGYELYANLKDSSRIEMDKQDEIIKAKDIEIVQNLQALAKSSANADKWQSLYKAARENQDTVTMVYACDSLSAEFDEFRAATDAAVMDFQYQDSMKSAKLETALFALANAETQIRADSILKKQLFAEIDQHLKKDKQQEKKLQGKKFWRWTERVAIVVGSVFLTAKAVK
jgi:hypothetical protein